MLVSIAIESVTAIFFNRVRQDKQFLTKIVRLMRKESQRWERPSTDAEERRALRRARRLCKNPEASPSNTSEPDNAGDQSSLDVPSTQDIAQSKQTTLAEDSIIPSNVRVS